MNSEWLIFYACRHLIDEKYGKVYELELIKTEIDIEDFKEFAMEDYIKKFELNNEQTYECPICLI